MSQRPLFRRDDGKRHRQIFWQDTCKLANSYYSDQNGDVPLRPARTAETYWRSRLFPHRNYAFSGQGPARAAFSSAG